MKRKRLEPVSIPMVLFDSKSTLDMKIEKHIDLNALTRHHPASQPSPDLDSLILRKMKELLATNSDRSGTSSSSSSSNVIHNEREDTDARWNNLERGERDNDNEADTVAKPHNRRSNPVDSHRLDDFLEYDIIDGSPTGLAVAVPVDNDDINNAKLPSAVQYDPSTKPLLFTTQRYYLLIYLLIMMAINGAVGGYIGMMYIYQNNNTAPLE